MGIKSLISNFKKAILFALVLPLSTTSCFGKKASSDVTVEISNVKYGFINVENVTDDSQISLDNEDMVQLPTLFNVGDSYYFLFTCTITSRNDNDGTGIVETNFNFDNSSLIDGYLYTLNSGGNHTKQTIKDENSGTDGIRLSVSNKVTTKKDDYKNINIVLTILIRKYSKDGAYISCDFSSNSVTALKGDYEGFYKHLQLYRVTLDTPVLTYKEKSLELQWNHIKHADYYKAYIDGIEHDKTFNNVTENTAVGSQLYWDLSGDYSGYHRIKIQAFSNTAEYLPSNYSNEVEVNF